MSSRLVLSGTLMIVISQVGNSGAAIADTRRLTGIGNNAVHGAA